MAVALTSGEHQAYVQLDERLRTLLPAEYHACYEDMEPRPMGSAGLKYDDEGNVAWDRMWGSFCNLAMAGGPPHKGRLLQPGDQDAIDAQFDRYDDVVDEICRGVRMVTGLRAYPCPTPGWVSVNCQSDTMAEWLLRAIVMENVAVRRAGSIIDLPAAPHFRLEKEIKNVITVIAKTTHYWLGHMPRAQQRAIGELFTRLNHEHPLLTPACDAGEDARSALRNVVCERIARDAGLPAASVGYPGWCGLECPDVLWAVWMMRALVASNVLARREERTLFVPIDPALDPDGSRAADAVARVHRFAAFNRSVRAQPGGDAQRLPSAGSAKSRRSSSAPG